MGEGYMNKKICIFNESISKSGGIERVTVNLANMWVKNGADVTKPYHSRRNFYK